MFSFPPVILVFKTAVVFVCKEGSKQKKKMVRLLYKQGAFGSTLLQHCKSNVKGKAHFTGIVLWEK